MSHRIQDTWSPCPYRYHFRYYSPAPPLTFYCIRLPYPSDRTTPLSTLTPLPNDVILAPKLTISAADETKEVVKFKLLGKNYIQYNP